MEILIKPFGQAVDYVPTKPTYAIRIFSSKPKPTDGYSLAESPHYQQIKIYRFDDIETLAYLDYQGLNEETAKQILLDFKEGRVGIETLMVHCTAGVGRSPAVAIALDEVFNLTGNPQKLKKENIFFNPYVYRVLKQAAEKFKIN